MKPMSIAETQNVQGGALSGALFTGIAAVIEGINNLITNIGGMAFAFSQPQHVKGEVHFNKTFSFNWDDTKLLQDPLVAQKWTDKVINHNPTSSHICNLQ